MDPRLRETFEAILENVERIGAYVAKAGPDWTVDDMAVDAIAKRLEDTGEQAKQIPAEILETMPAVDWKGLKALRDFLAHNYRQVVVSIIGSTLSDDLPILAETVRTALDEADERTAR